MRGMKLFAALLFFLVAPALAAQGPARGRIEEPRDPILETQAKHNLQVGRWYLTKQKAYEGARDRFQEIIDTYPEFSRMDEVLFLMGETHEGLKKPEKAVEYYEKLLKDFPESEFAKKTKERLEKLKPEGVRG